MGGNDDDDDDDADDACDEDDDEYVETAVWSVVGDSEGEGKQQECGLYRQSP